MDRRGYHPNRRGLPLPTSVTFPIEVKVWSFEASHQFDRAERAIDRFKGFENRRADGEAVFELIDAFFEAALTIRHCYDAADKALEEGEGKTLLRELMDTRDQQALRTIANASKHSGIDRGNPFPDGEIIIDQAGQHHQDPETLAEVYRRLELRVPGSEPEHPADFLTRVMNQWNKFALDTIYTKQFLEKLESE